MLDIRAHDISSFKCACKPSVDMQECPYITHSRFDQEQAVQEAVDRLFR